MGQPLINDLSGVQVSAFTLANPWFATPSQGAGAYTYNPTGGSWTFTGNSGVQSNGSAWGAPAAPVGTQTAFMQYPAGISQMVYEPDGTYTLSFDAALRAGGNGVTAFSVLVDGTSVGTFSPTSTTSWTTYTTSPFTLASSGGYAGNHTVAFQFTGPAADANVFITGITFGLINGSFEMPGVGSGNYLYNPVGESWTFTGNSGVQINGSAWGAPTTSSGTQTAFLQIINGANNGSISQTVNVNSAGSHTLSFQSALRSSPHNGAISFNVLVDGTVVGTCAPTTTGSFTSYTTSPFTITTLGNHTVTFTAVGTAIDSSVFIDAVSMQ
jgi:hypothetical protein